MARKGSNSLIVLKPTTSQPLIDIIVSAKNHTHSILWTASKGRVRHSWKVANKTNIMPQTFVHIHSDVQTKIMHIRQWLDQLFFKTSIFKSWRNTHAAYITVQN